MELDKFTFIKDFIWNKDEDLRRERFDVAWDVGQHFFNLKMSLKIDLAKDVEKMLKERCPDDWKVWNEVSESSIYYKDYAGIFLYRTNWVLKNKKDDNESKVLVGLQAAGTEFNLLYTCVKCNEVLSPILKRALGDKKYPTFPVQRFQIYKIKEIETSMYKETSNKPFFLNILTTGGWDAACAYYADEIYRLKEELWKKIDLEVAKRP
jgi:hypothetical protein